MKTMQIISRQTAYWAASGQCDCNCDCACMDQLTRHAVSTGQCDCNCDCACMDQLSHYASAGQCDCNCDCACLNELTQSAVMTALGDRACLSELSYPSAITDQCDCDCDCACLDYHRRPAPLQVAALPDVAWRRPAAIYSAPLSAGGEQYMLAFNPRAGQLPAVLSQAAATLWERFATPTHVGSVIENSATAPAETRQAVKHLAALRLIEPETAAASRTCADTPTTLAAWLHVTNACNLQCAYCYLNKTHETMSAETGRQAVEAIFRSAQIHGFRAIKLKYAGGEPTLNFGRVLEMHQHARNLAKEHGLVLDGVVLSNGVSLSERMLDAMKANDLRLMISLDGLGAMHDAQRVFPNGQGSFAWVERGIARAMERGLTPDISIVVSDRNAAGLPELMGWVLERDLPFGLNFYRENDCSASQQDLQLSEQRIIDALRAAYGVIAENLPQRSLMGSLLDRANLAAPHQHTCGVGRNYLVIDHLGQVSKCQMDMGHTVSSISAPDPLHDVQSDRAGLQNLAVEDKEGCRECAWQHWCTGSCPLYTYRVTGRYDIQSPNCAIYQALFPEALRLEGLRLLKYSVRH